MYSEKGQSLLELVVVIGVVVIVVGALVFATIASLRNASFSRNQAQATKLAQEGLEWVRLGRDRNSNISNIPSTSVVSWNGTGNNDAIWNYHISGSTQGVNCDYELANPPTSNQCYFKISPDGSLRNIIATTTFPTDNAEPIPTPPATAVFKRAITLSDDLNDDKIFNNDNWQNAKKATSIVTWTDFSGSHESRLTTILRKL